MLRESTLLLAGESQLFDEPGQNTRFEKAEKELIILKRLPQKSQGIVFIRIDFTPLLVNPDWHIPSLKDIKIQFADSKSSSTFEIILSLQSIKEHLISDLTKPVILQNNNFLVKKHSSGRQHEVLKKGFIENIFPRDSEHTKKYVQKRIWLEINGKANLMRLCQGDIQKQVERDTILWQGKMDQELVERRWDNEVDVFPLAPGKNVPKQCDFLNVTNVSIKLHFNSSGNEFEKLRQKHELMECLQINVLQLTRKEGPVLSRNPSILQQHIAQANTMSPGIQKIFTMLEQLCLYKLPEYEMNSSNHGEFLDYINWGNAAFAIHNSLVTPYSFVNGFPVGILNHMYKVKRDGKIYNPMQFTKEDGSNKTLYEIENEIYKERSGYLRFQVLPQEGFSPGSPAVFEIWPPWGCSTIHDHGDAQGVIKVLYGNIHVQNFKNLSHLQEKPYTSNNYKEGSYTWLTPFSYTVHRLVNVHSQTCLTLQAYSNTETSHQYFGVLGGTRENPQFKKYYPQHDWRNYLSRWKDEKLSPQDRHFIEKVREKYNLKDPKVDAGFMKFVLTIKKEFQLGRSIFSPSN